MTIIRNSARCHGCDTEIESTHRHDFVSCPCGSLAVDGGHAYLRRVFSETVPHTDTSITTDEEIDDNE